VYGPPDGPLNQGDVIAGVPFYIRQDHSRELVSVPGLVYSHSCDIDKYDETKHSLTGNQKKRWPVQMIPLLSPKNVDAGALGDVKAGRHRRYFYLPKESPHHELVADFWLAQPIPLLVVQGLQRVATLSDEHLAKLWTHSFVAVSRKDPARVFQGGRLAS